MKKLLTHVLIFTVLVAPALVLAQGSTDKIGLQNPIKVNSISALILIVTRVVRYIAIPFIVIMIMWAGFLFIWARSGAKSGDLNKAKDALFYTVIGAFILLSSELIAQILKNTVEGLTK